MAVIKAIETYYDGHRFRSRLEARWYIVFDKLELGPMYEPEGFILPDGTYYLPDFYLPTLRTWVEVKGVMDDTSRKKIEAFASQLPEGQRLWVVHDIPNIKERSFGLDSEGMEMYWRNDAMDWPYYLCVCPKCGRVGIEYDGRGWRVDDCHSDDLSDLYYPGASCLNHGDKGYSYNAPKILKAYDAARMARFEHGESPK